MTGGVAIFSPEFFADPYAFYGHLRETDPVHWHPGLQTWIVTRWEDVNAIARRPEAFSSRLSALDTEPSPPVRAEDRDLVDEVDAVHVEEFIQLDPPQHTAKRACVAPRFSPRSLEPLRDTIRGIVDELLDAVADRGGMDVLAAVAKPLPLLVVSRLMGIPDADVADVAAQATRRMANVLSLAEDRLQVAVEGFRETAAHVSPAIDARLAGAADRCPVGAADRRRGAVVTGRLGDGELGDDVLGDMALAELSGQWSRAESLANAMMIIDAGHETTIQLICNGTLQLLRHPEQWRLLREDPRGVAPTAVEEALRYDPPLHALRRIVVEDTTLQGVVLRTGERVMAVVASANRDPRRFPDPETFDVLRRPNTHLSFGVGAHFCLGQYLAKVEAQEYLVALAERFPGARPPAEGSVSYSPVPRVRSMTALPIRWG